MRFERAMSKVLILHKTKRDVLPSKCVLCAVIVVHFRVPQCPLHVARSRLVDIGVWRADLLLSVGGL